MSEKERIVIRHYVEEFSESGGTDSSDSSRISSNDSDGNEELGVQPYLYELEDDGSPERRQSDSDDEDLLPDMEITIGRQTNTNFQMIMSLQITSCVRDGRHFVDKSSELVCCFYVWVEHKKS